MPSNEKAVLVVPFDERFLEPIIFAVENTCWRALPRSVNCWPTLLPLTGGGRGSLPQEVRAQETKASAAAVKRVWMLIVVT